MSSIPGVEGVSAFSGTFAKHFDGLNMQVWVDNRQNAKSLDYYYADAAFVNNMKLPIVAGRNFSENESANNGFVLVNQAAVRLLGIASDNAAIGQRIWVSDTSRLEIAGVLKDFHFENAGLPIGALALRAARGAYTYLYVNASQQRRDQIRTEIRKAMAELLPSQEFDGEWLDERLYNGNSQAATISLLGYLAFIAIAIASLGLLGLVIYTVETRRKEVSIRKVVGAGEGALVLLLSKRFVWLLVISGAIAMPVGYLAGKLFLQGFVDRVGFGAGHVLAGFALLLLIGLGVIVSQTYKAAARNPVKSLRME
jgi:putative ABC transport system permease protein